MCIRDRFNTDQSGITDEDLIIDDNGYGIRLGIIQQGIYFNYDYGKGKNWPFQLTQNLNADMFSGYMHDAKPCLLYTSIMMIKYTGENLSVWLRLLREYSKRNKYILLV